MLAAVERYATEVSVVRERVSPKGRRTLDLKEYVGHATAEAVPEGARLSFAIRHRDDGAARPQEFIDLIATLGGGRPGDVPPRTPARHLERSAAGAGPRGRKECVIVSAAEKAPGGDKPSTTPPEPQSGERASAGGPAGNEQTAAGDAGANRRRRGSRGGRRRRKPADPQTTRRDDGRTTSGRSGADCAAVTSGRLSRGCPRRR